jgi:diguanylate cyclase (GGDEF)-like protein
MSEEEKEIQKKIDDSSQLSFDRNSIAENSTKVVKQIAKLLNLEFDDGEKDSDYFLYLLLHDYLLSRTLNIEWQQAIRKAFLGAELLYNFNTKASVDKLTQLWNVRATEDRFEEVVKLINKSEETDHPQKGFICFVDADHFKEINDTYGHKAGDDLLKKLALLLKDNTKSMTDFTSKIGGDEFTMIFTFPKADEERMRERIIKIHEKIKENLFIEIGGKRIYLRVSIGVAIITENSHYEEAKERADARLYEVKGQGKNKVVFEDSILEKSKH